MSEENKSKVLEEYTRDVRSYMSTMKFIVIALSVVLALMVAGFVLITMHYQSKIESVANYSADKMVELLSEYDWEVEYEITSTGNDYYSGNIYVEK